MKIGFLSPNNPYNRNSFSGTPFYMLRELQELPEINVHVLGGHKPLPQTRIGRRIERTFRPKTLTVEPKALEGLDVILAPVGFECLKALPADCDLPIVVATDATPRFLREFYGWELPEGHEINEAEGLERADLAIYSSHFMRDLAKDQFSAINLPPLAVQPFGLNLDRLPPPPDDKGPFDPLRLVFIGQEWVRKGGDLAVEAVKLLRARGRLVTLTCIGARPELDSLPDWLTYHGYLDKNDPAELAVFERSLSEAHVMVLPTRADCTPMVIAEANAFGCPVIVTDTGGIGSLMDPPRNGQMVPEGSGAAGFAAAIDAVTEEPDTYRALSTSSYAHCSNHLTWEAWARGVTGHLERLLSARQETPLC